MRFVLLTATVLTVATVVVHADEPPTPTQVREWERALATHETGPEARAKIRRLLAKLKPAAAVQDLLRSLLGGAHPQLRIEGAKIAQLMGARARPLTAALLENLRDRDASVRAAAAEALGTVADPVAGERVRTRLAIALDDKQAGVRASALIGLAALDELSEDAVLDRLLDAGGSNETILTLLHRQDDAATRTTNALLLAESRNLRESVLRTMWLRMRVIKKEAPLASWTRLAAQRLKEDGSGAVRWTALQVLSAAAAQGLELTPHFVPAFRDADPTVRATAYRIADAHGLAADPRITTLLVTDMELAEPHARSSAAWLLRAARADFPGIEGALRARIATGTPQEARAASAALLERGVLDTALQERLITFIAEDGVEPPYPEPDIGGRLFGRKQILDGYPQFMPTPRWNAARITQAGAALLEPLRMELRRAKGKVRMTWVHALATVGPKGIAVLQRERPNLSNEERFTIDVVRAHRGAQGKELLASMLAVVERYDGTLDEEIVSEGDDAAMRRAFLAAGALEAIGAPAVPGLIELMRAAPVSDDGHIGVLLENAERILVRIGKPALPAVKKAAADEEERWRFESLLERLTR